MAGLLAAHALAGQPLNATTAVNYTRCGQFQKVRENTCVAANACGGAERFKDGPTASRAEAFALCDADPECDAVQQYGDEALIKEEKDDWAESCGADTCYMKCKNLGKDGCGRTRLVGSGYSGDRRLSGGDDDEVLLDDAEILWDDDGGRRLYGGDDYESPAQHVYTCRPHDDIGGMRSPAGFWLCIIAVILSVPLGWASCKVLRKRFDPSGDAGRRPGSRFGWSLCAWLLGALLVTIGFALWASHFGPIGKFSKGGCDERMFGAAVGVHSAAGFLLVAASVGLLAHKYGPQDDAGGGSKVAPAVRGALRGFQGSQQHQNVAPVTYAATVVPQQQQTISVTIPSAATPGSVLNCPLPDGRTVQVTVPPGSAPGAVIQVAVPP